MHPFCATPALFTLLACGTTAPGDDGDAASGAANATSLDGEEQPPVGLPGMERVDHLIQEGETHFAGLWKLTAGGENAEAYLSYAGDRLVLQRRHESEGIECDRIYVTDAERGLVPVSNGRGVTTCSYFLPGDREVVYASTHGAHETCPDKPFYPGYVWYLHPEYELWVNDLETGHARKITDRWGYDAEATVSPLGDRMVFTSLRTGDVELFTCDLDGGNVVQVTDELGYDGGAFFSHDGSKLVFRSTAFPEGEEGEAQRGEYRMLLERGMVKPSAMELRVCDVDGTNRRTVTNLGDANWAPYFFPTDDRIVFSTNHHRENKRIFDLFAIDEDGGNLERITTYEGFDSFPYFTRDGRWLVFSSNRGGSVEGETNVFIARWQN